MIYKRKLLILLKKVWESFIEVVLVGFWRLNRSLLGGCKERVFLVEEVVLVKI